MATAVNGLSENGALLSPPACPESRQHTNAPRTVGSLTPLCHSYSCPCAASLLVFVPFFLLYFLPICQELKWSCHYSSPLHKSSYDSVLWRRYIKSQQQQEGEWMKEGYRCHFLAFPALPSGARWGADGLQTAYVLCGCGEEICSNIPCLNLSTRAAAWLPAITLVSPPPRLLRSLWRASGVKSLLACLFCLVRMCLCLHSE